MNVIDKVNQFSNDVDLMHQWAHGDKNTSVQTENGPLRSPAKLLDEYENQFAQNVIDLDQIATDVSNLKDSIDGGTY